jgi:hypothetical protein
MTPLLFYDDVQLFDFFVFLSVTGWQHWETMLVNLWDEASLLNLMEGGSLLYLWLNIEFDIVHFDFLCLSNFLDFLDLLDLFLSGSISLDRLTNLLLLLWDLSGLLDIFTLDNCDRGRNLLTSLHDIG